MWKNSQIYEKKTWKFSKIKLVNLWEKLSKLLERIWIISEMKVVNLRKKNLTNLQKKNKSGKFIRKNLNIL